MKIDILTFHWTINYGGVLQAYALQEALKGLGHNPEFINYTNEAEILSALSLKRRILHGGWEFIARTFLGRKKREERTQNYRESYLNIPSKEYHSMEDLDALPVPDAYIVGSDQVWNPELTSNPDVYLLSFAKHSKKIAYAASFGKASLNEKYVSLYQTELNGFSSISVREEDAAQLLTDMGVQDVSVVLDPVFLLDREKWLATASDRLIKDDYVLCYYMPTSDTHITDGIGRVAEQVAEAYGCRVVNIGKKEFEKLKFWETNLLDAGPAEFISLIANARFVVTNSFHGTAFSLKMNVPFAALINYDIPQEQRLANRIECLLKKFNCENRSVSCHTTETDKSLLDMDFSETNKIMEEKIDESISFLRDALAK